MATSEIVSGVSEDRFLSLRSKCHEAQASEADFIDTELLDKAILKFNTKLAEIPFGKNDPKYIHLLSRASSIINSYYRQESRKKAAQARWLQDGPDKDIPGYITLKFGYYQSIVGGNTCLFSRDLVDDMLGLKPDWRPHWWVVPNYQRYC